MTLHPIFSSHMVMPAGKTLRIFGTGDGDIHVTFGGKTAVTTANTGKWQISFAPMNYGGPYEMTVTDGKETVILNDIWVGEVYLCAGQSNMQFKLKESNTPPSDWRGCDMLRVYSTERLEDDERFGPADGWVICDAQNAADFSAIGYLVGRHIAEKKNVAVGLIACYQGASVIESWVPAGTMRSLGISLTKEEKFYDHFAEPYVRWNGDGCLYDHHLEKQILPYAVSAVIWYQGESDASPAEAAVYAKELCALIRIWRHAFYDDSLPFVIVQIADCEDRMANGAWKTLQEAQEKVPSMIGNAITVISRDVCETDNIHPATKDKLADRIAEALL